MYSVYDVVVIGGGNAGLCSAISAGERGKRVLILENAESHLMGGNTRYTRDIRYMHDSDKYTSGAYTFNEIYRDLNEVSNNSLNREMASHILNNSVDIPEWMEAHGIILKREIKGTLNLARTNVFFMGGGLALINTYKEMARKLGVASLCNAEVNDLCIKGNRINGINVTINGEKEKISCKNAIVCSGGFEANMEWLVSIWGDAARKFKIRGNINNTGKPLKSLIEAGAEVTGEPGAGHMVAVDARSPDHDGGIVTRIDAIPYGIVVNKNGVRFYDEGEDIWPKRYAIWGHLVAEQSGQIAYVITDATVQDKFLPPIYQPIMAGSIEELARLIDVDSKALLSTVNEFNKAGEANSSGDFGSSGMNNNIPKSHFYKQLFVPPYYAIPVSPGMTFTYMGVKINKQSRIIMKDGELENGYAAGEIVSGNVLKSGYLAGFGLTIGTVTGRIAGREVM